MLLIEVEELVRIIKNVLKENQPELIKKEMSDSFLSRVEAFQFLKVSSTTFDKLRKQGVVSPIRLGKKTLYKKSALLNINNN